jgi:acyl carrier protein
MTTQVPTPAELLVQLTSMIGEVVSDVPDSITADSRLREDLGFDSVAQMELISVVDEQLGLDVDLEDVMHLVTVGDVVDVIHRTLGRGAEA